MRFLKVLFVFSLLFILCLNINKGVVNAEEHNHQYIDGICECGIYEEPGWDQHRVGWIVENAGQLLWAIDKQNKGELNHNIIIVNDINISEDIEFTPFGTLEHPFRVCITTYDDSFYTINLNKRVVTKSNYGLIGYAAGESGDRAEVHNIRVVGEFDIDATVECVGGIVGTANDYVRLKNVISDVNITTLSNAVGSKNIAGLVGKGLGDVIIMNCSNYGDLNVDGVYEFVSGIIGNMEEGYISGAANYGDITASDAKYVGGILGYVDNENFFGVYSTINLGNITAKTFNINVNGEEYEMTSGEIIGYVGKFTSGEIFQNFITKNKAYGVVIYEDLSIESVYVTSEQIENGYAAYKLGTSFGQKLDNLSIDVAKEQYPIIGSDKVYQVLKCNGTEYFYSNFNENEQHKLKYHSSENIIYETCENCSHNKKIEILPPENINFDKTVKEVVINSDIEDLNLDDIDIEYNAEAIFPGKYTATIRYKDVAAKLEFTIQKGIPEIDMFTFIEPGELTYDGNKKFLNLFETTETGMGKINVKYRLDDDTLDYLCDAGYYSVILSVEEGVYYQAYEFSVLELFKSVIVKPKEITLEWTKTTVFLKEDAEYNIYTPEYKLNGLCNNDSPVVQFSNHAITTGTYTTSIKVIDDNYVLVGDNLTVEYTVKKILVEVPEIPYCIYNPEVLYVPEIKESKYYRVVSTGNRIGLGKMFAVLELTDPSKYTWETTDDAQITVNYYVHLAKGEWETYPTISDWTYGETPILPTYKANSPDLGIYISYRPLNGTFSNEIPTEVGKYEVKISTETTDPKISPIEDVLLSFEIKKANPDCIIDSVFNINYGTKLSEVLLLGFGDGTWEYKDDNDLMLNAGTHEIELVFTPYNTRCYNTISKVVTFNVAPIEIEYSQPLVNEGLVYNNNYQALVVPGSAINGTMYYKVNDGDWSVNIPLAKDAGTYTVYYKVVGNGNYIDVEEQTISVTIDKASLTITADDKEVEQYSLLPSLTYTVNGLLPYDSFVTPPKCSVSISDTNTIGEYEITVDKVENTNYIITYVNGKLIINKHLVCSGGNSTCTKKAICDLCGLEYGELSAHEFKDYVYNNDATTTKDGTISSKCEHCEKINTIVLENTKVNFIDQTPQKNRIGLGILIGSLSALIIACGVFFVISRRYQKGVK